MKKSWNINAGGTTYNFGSLKELMAKASPRRSGDELAGIAAADYQERVAAQMCLADVPLEMFLEEPLIPYEDDEITRLILDSHDKAAFAPISSLTVGEFRDWLLRYETDGGVLESVCAGLTPEMVAAVSKIMGNQDLILVASKRRVVTKFRDTLGLAGRFSSRLQPNDPSDNLKAIAASILDGLLYGSGDAVIGINPATDSVPAMTDILKLVDELVTRYEIPTQSCVLSHITNAIAVMENGGPVDLVFQSIAGTQKANENFGINLAMLKEAHEAALSLHRGTVGDNVMYFETGQGWRCPPRATTVLTCRRAKPAPMRLRARSVRCLSTPLSGSSAPSIYTTASRLSARVSRTIFAESSWGFRWAATSATQTTPRRIRTIWTLF